jgi:maleylpyruvate isomerase
MKLYGFWRSSATWRVRIALHLKQLTFEYEPVSLIRGDQRAAAFRALNPMQHVPVLAIEHAGKTHHVTESLAIIALLDELHPSPPLFPRDPFARAQAQQIALLIASGIQPLLNTKVQAWVRDTLQADPSAWASHWLSRGLEALEASVRDSAGRFAVGDDLTIADICLVPQLYMARRLSVPLSDYVTVLQIERACLALPAFQQAQPENQPDYEGG